MCWVEGAVKFMAHCNLLAVERACMILGLAAPTYGPVNCMEMWCDGVSSTGSFPLAWWLVGWGMLMGWSFM